MRVSLLDRRLRPRPRPRPTMTGIVTCRLSASQRRKCSSRQVTRTRRRRRERVSTRLLRGVHQLRPPRHPFRNRVRHRARIRDDDGRFRLFRLRRLSRLCSREAVTSRAATRVKAKRLRKLPTPLSPPRRHGPVLPWAGAPARLCRGPRGGYLDMQGGSRRRRRLRHISCGTRRGGCLGPSRARTRTPGRASNFSRNHPDSRGSQRARNRCRRRRCRWRRL